MRKRDLFFLRFLVSRLVLHLCTALFSTFLRGFPFFLLVSFVRVGDGVSLV